mgnify:CR=1 FL=1
MEDLILQMGKRGTLVIPAKLRKSFGLVDGSLMLLREKDGAIELRPARAQALFSDGKTDANTDAKTDAKMDPKQEPKLDPRWKMAQLLLSSAEGLGEYLAAIEEVRRMGFDPDHIPHERYSG